MRTPTPDVVLIVMDCVRSDLFREELDAGNLPFLASVRDEFLDFPRAVAPASWTIPSHASLFTGLYPWDHGAHYKSGAILGATAPTLAEFLRGRGYRTASFSANGYVQPGTGLTRGFETALWGGDQEFFLRVLARSPSCPPLNGADSAVHAILDRAPSASSLRVGTMRALSRFTAACDLLNRVGGRIVQTSPAYVGSWIEPEFRAALMGSKDRPFFFFVNLLEAHEPYLAEAGLPIGLRDWISYARTTQVSEQWTRGERRPTARDLAWARRGYRASLRVIDRRIATLVGLLKAEGRWENTVLILTSDHGQTFGEEGSMYHRLNLQEQITRIPLWLKPARPAVPSPSPEEIPWVSLVDVPATVVAAVAPGVTFGDPSSRPLGAIAGTDARTVYSMTDGISKHEAATFPEERRRALDRVQIAGYRGAYKVIVDQGGTRSDLKLTETGARPVAADDPGFDPAGFDDILPKLRAVLSLPEPTSVSQRIAGWGY